MLAILASGGGGKFKAGVFFDIAAGCSGVDFDRAEGEHPTPRFVVVRTFDEYLVPAFFQGYHRGLAEVVILIRHRAVVVGLFPHGRRNFLTVHPEFGFGVEPLSRHAHRSVAPIRRCPGVPAHPEWYRLGFR